MIDRDVLNAIIQEAINFPRIPTFKRPYELHKRVHLIDIPTCGIRGYINGKPNRLTRAFFTAIINWFTSANLNTPNVDGTNRPICYGVYGSYSKAYIGVGADTDEFLFSDYTMVSRSDYSITLGSFQELSDRIRVIAEAISGKDGSSIGLIPNLHWTSDSGTKFLIAGRLQSVSNGQTIDYYLDFLEPWLRNFALIWYGLIAYEDPTLTDVGGGSFTCKVKGKNERGSTKLVLGTSNNPFSFDDYYLTNEVEIGTNNVRDSKDYCAFIIYYNNYVPASDLQIYEVGLRQTLKDSGGVSHEALLCRIVLSTPITLVAGKNNLIMLRILGM